MLGLDEADRLLGKGFQTEMNGVLDYFRKGSGLVIFSHFPKKKHMVPQVDVILKRMGIPEPPLRISCANSTGVPKVTISHRACRKDFNEFRTAN
jgi:superfamily II DNA/RNA helicase